MPLLTFDQFEAAVGPLLDEAAGARDDLPAAWRLGDQGGGGTTRSVRSATPSPRWPGSRPGSIVRSSPARTTSSQTGGRRAAATCAPEALTAVAQLLEALAAVRSTMPGELAAARAAGERGAIARCAFETFAAPGGLPVEGLEWIRAIEHAGLAATGLANPRLGAEIGPSLAHDALERSAGCAVCVLALIDARRATASP